MENNAEAGPSVTIPAPKEQQPTNVLCLDGGGVESNAEAAPSSTIPEPKKQKPINILCLDSGGVRGYSSLIILQSLLTRLRISSRQKSMPFPHEVFDVICGTSTGGLIALMLGRLKMSVDDAITAYMDLCTIPFKRRCPIPIWRWMGKPRYHASNLEKTLNKVITEHAAVGVESLRDPQDGADPSLCRTFGVACKRERMEEASKVFRTYALEGHEDDYCSNVEAGRATTAAPTYFAPVEISNTSYIDGGLGGDNNPARLALEEIGKVFPGRPVSCFLSLGTATPHAIDMGGNIFQLGKACARVLTSCERPHALVESYFKRIYGEVSIKSSSMIGGG